MPVSTLHQHGIKTPPAASTRIVKPSTAAITIKNATTPKPAVVVVTTKSKQVSRVWTTTRNTELPHYQQLSAVLFAISLAALLVALLCLLQKCKKWPFSAAKDPNQKDPTKESSPSSKSIATYRKYIARLGKNTVNIVESGACKTNVTSNIIIFTSQSSRSVSSSSEMTDRSTSNKTISKTAAPSTPNCSIDPGASNSSIGGVLPTSSSSSSSSSTSSNKVDSRAEVKSSKSEEKADNNNASVERFFSMENPEDA